VDRKIAYLEPHLRNGPGVCCELSDVSVDVGKKRGMNDAEFVDHVANLNACKTL